MNLVPPLHYRRYRVFISHAWQYNDDYEGVKRLLRADPSFTWDDLSVPFDEPLNLSPVFPRSYGVIVDQLRERIRQADCLLVIAAMYCAHRGWIQTEIEAAKQSGKPVIAVRPLGQERLPAVIQEATEQAGWRTTSIIGAIKRLAIPGYTPGELQALGGITGATGPVRPPAPFSFSPIRPPMLVGPCPTIPIARPSQLAGISPPRPLGNIAALISEPQESLTGPADGLRPLLDNYLALIGPPKR
jgi:hypothetical protein